MKILVLTIIIKKDYERQRNIFVEFIKTFSSTKEIVKCRGGQSVVVLYK